MTKSQTIFFDESGFTGNDLLTDEQPVFVYTGIAMDSSQAAEIVNKMISRFGLQGKEIKGSNLLSYTRGQDAVLWLIERCKGKASVVIVNKKFALAGKFFEYIFEPVFKADNSLFYAIRFHEFISNFLYFAFLAKKETVVNLLTEFQSLMRLRDTTSIERLLPPGEKIVAVDDPVSQIQAFIICHQEQIQKEIVGLGDVGGVAKWVLELSTTCLFWTLSFWSEQFEKLEVYCDKSKPIIEEMEIFNVMIGREENIYIKLGSDKERRLTYNLAGPITFLDSRDSQGIQIADVFSSAVAYAYNHPDIPFSGTCIKLAESAFSPLCILPDYREINLREKIPFINGVILHELLDRSVKKQDLIYGMREFVLSLYTQYELSPPKLTSGSE